MEKNKTGKYFKYAIGEIVLVVIGILIALQINNWNENQKLKSIEQNLLEDLQEEVSNNIKDLKRVIGSHENSLAGAQKIDELFNDRQTFNTMSDSTFNSLYNEMNSHATYKPNRGILNSIISSGQIKNISNEELKYQLSSIQEQTIHAFELTMVIAGWRPELLSSIYKERFVIEQDKIVGFRTKNVYDMPDFRLYNSYLFVDLRIQGLKKENDLKVKMEHMLKLIKSEIKK